MGASRCLVFDRATMWRQGKKVEAVGPQPPDSSGKAQARGRIDDCAATENAGIFRYRSEYLSRPPE